MEVKEKSKKRELIKTIAIIFLVVLLLLTFFSQTIMNHSLPEVATQMASSGSINAKIRGSGSVAANESYEVNIKQTREVRSVCVKVGDHVETGDLLFVLGDIESQELKAAQEALENARISYQRRVLELSKTYASEDQNVKTIREDLEEAYAKRDANLVTDEQVSYAKGDLAEAKSVLSQIDFALKELNARQSESEGYADAKAKVDELEAKVKGLESTIEGYEADLEKLDTGDDVSAERKIRDAQDALDDAVNNWMSDWRAYGDTIRNLASAIGGLYISTTGGTYTFTTSDQITIEGKLRQWALMDPPGTSGNGDAGAEPQASSGNERPDDFNKWQTAYNALLADQQDVEAKQQALQRLQQDSSSASSDAYQQRRAIQDKIDSARSDLSIAQRDLRSAQAEMDSAASQNSQLKELIRTQEAYQRQQEAQITNLESILADLQEKQSIYKAALDTISAKERELENALSGKDIDKQLNNLDLQSMSIEIEKQQELVDKYKKDSVDAEITSPVSGVITAISVSAGKETTPDAAMATIDVVDRGYTIKIPVTNEQAKQVKVGDTADVTNYYWGSDITATLEQIAPDPSSAGQKKLLVFRVTGDIDAGTNITLSIGQRSANFDTIVPKSALREDSNGKFVYVITSKSTPLGNRYTATRVDVQVLAEDDTSAAVSGLAQNDYVITTASKPLDAGTQVRMVENP
ncbi:MAG: HlyD family efflux transporter periplasmic adaptor subunit [Oscillospiraceae bacterium]|nr:HlyD family efflux transporter periplasmic adaptor subunit [Oscillospiraceae bacterium]